LKEEKRLFAWMIISFFLSNLLVGYVDNFIESFRLSPFLLVILSQLLLLFPILIIGYIIKQFKQKINPYIQKPILTGEIQFPINIVISLSKLLLIICFLFVLSIGLLLIIRGEMQWQSILFLLLFSSTNALLEEVLWRGMFLSKLIYITNQRIGVLVSSIAYGLNTTMFGFSLLTSITYLILGLSLGYLTVRSKSILPSVIAHTLITTILIVTGWIVIPMEWGKIDFFKNKNC
jgi:membrane protease YdiL (CAAX protease family)